jgi:hypothetical protein
MHLCYAQPISATACVCRTTADGHWDVSKPVGEEVIVSVEATRDGSTNASTYYSSNWDTGGKGGELLRLDVSQTSSGACAQAFSTELVDDEPQWLTLQNAACFSVPLTDQGIAAHDGDVLFVGAKMSQITGPSAPVSATTYIDPNNNVSGESYDIQNLSWSRFPPNH